MIRNRVSFFTIVLVTTLIVTAQSGTDPFPETAIGHPDGHLHRFSIQASGAYQSRSSEQQLGLVDLQRYEMALSLVVHPQVTISGQTVASVADSNRYEAVGALTLYLRSPLCADCAVNPDGRIGSPVIKLEGGGRLKSAGIAGKTIASIRLLLPITSLTTAGALYRYVQDREPDEVQEFAGIIRQYIAPYHSDSSFVNPDGPVGYPALELMAGGASEGYFGKIGLRFPLNPHTTLLLEAEAERGSSYDFTTYGLSIGLAFYPRR